MQGILSAFRRLRHSRGFGIHSPFAYRFVTEVLCQRLPYYGYRTVGHDRTHRLLLRLTAYFRPVTAAVYAADTRPAEATMCLADSKIKFTSADTIPTFVVADAAHAPLERYLGNIVAGAHALVLHTDGPTMAAIRAAIPAGMTFDNGHGTLVVAGYPHLPRQDFDVKF